jgi:hypothetical protein
MTAYTWANTEANGNWNVAANWIPSTGFPGVGDTVTLGAGSYTVTLPSSYTGTVSTLTVGSGVTLMFAATGQQLTVTNGLTLAGGTLTGGAGHGTVSSSTSVTGFGTIALLSHVASFTASGGALIFNTPTDGTVGGGPLAIANTANSALEFDGSFTVGASGTNDATITFQGTNSGVGTLDLASDTGAFFGTINNFTVGEKIAVVSGDTMTKSGNNLIIKSGATIKDTINLGSTAAVAAASFSGNVITTTICFMPGTRVRTPAGEVAVETLKRGDFVTTADGRRAPVRWLGMQTISTRFADPMRALPIRIKAGALGENVPSRDLRLSPGHAVFIDGALVIASALVNGSSVVRETDAPETFKYYHVETDDHALILAENTPAETFIDNVDRMNFDNWAEHQAIHGEGKPIRELPYPVAKSHRQVPMKTRAMLALRAKAIGEATDTAA